MSSSLINVKEQQKVELSLGLSVEKATVGSLLCRDLTQCLRVPPLGKELGGDDVPLFRPLCCVRCLSQHLGQENLKGALRALRASVEFSTRGTDPIWTLQVLLKLQ